MLGIKRLGLLAALVLVGVAPAAAAQAAAQPSTQDTQYLQALHQVNLFEITAGDLAQQKGQNQEVKDLGAMLKTDHTPAGPDGAADRVSSSTSSCRTSPPPTSRTVIDKLNNAQRRRVRQGAG